MGSDLAPDAPPSATLRIEASPGFAGFLAQQRLSLAFSTYQSCKLFFVGLNARGELSIRERTFSRCMGLWSDGQTLWMTTEWQLWRLVNVLAPGQWERGFDALYVPRAGYTTGDLDLHDVAQDGDGRPVFANTRFSCLATLSAKAGFRPLWRPPFVTRLAPEDRCHLNGLALEDGRPRWATACAPTDAPEGWREGRRDAGLLLDVRSGATLLGGLSMPHSPRLHAGRLWLLDSGRGHLLSVDPVRGTSERACFCPGYARGLARVGPFAVVGLSRPRAGTFRGLPLDDELAARGLEARTGLLVIDLRRGEALHWLRVVGPIEELYDVVALPGVTRPAALGFKSDEIRHTVTAEGESAIWRATPPAAG